MGERQDHSTEVVGESQMPTAAATLLRTLDAEGYIVQVNLEGGTITRRGPNEFVLTAGIGASKLTAVGYLDSATNTNSRLPTFEETLAKCATKWPAFWRSGAAVEFKGSTDSRAAQLENRVVMSQWVSKTQETGMLPPAEMSRPRGKLVVTILSSTNDSVWQ